MPRRAVHVMAALVVAGAAACAGGGALAQVKPGEDTGLGLMGRDTPELLKQAKANPYAAPAEPQCTSVPQELDALNELLGPDADQEAKKTSAGDVVGGAVRSFIPHRNVFRIVTGANKKDAELNEAIKAGWARRGYLKGLAKTLDCTSPKIAAADVAATPVSTTAPEAAPAPPPESPPTEASDQLAPPAPVPVAELPPVPVPAADTAPATLAEPPRS